MKNYKTRPTRKTPTYKDRISELLQEGFNNSEIKNILRKEFSILVTSSQIAQDRIKLLGPSKEMHSHKEKEIIQQIFESSSNSPKTLDEIRFILYKIHDHPIPKDRIELILRNDLNCTKQISPTGYTYTLSNKYTDSGKLQEEMELSSLESAVKAFMVNLEGGAVMSKLKEEIKKTFFQINTGSKKFDELIKSIVKDNRITQAEEVFLVQKIKENKLDIDLLEKAKKSLHINNPYLDNLIHVIFEDGQVTEEELSFLKEKTFEHAFSQKFVNNRFWLIGINYYLNYLLKINGFKKLIKLWYLKSSSKLEISGSLTKFFEDVNLFAKESLDEVVNYSVTNIEDDLRGVLEKTEPNFAPEQIISKIYQMIELEETEQTREVGNNDKITLVYLLKILEEEKLRIGAPEVNLLVENVKFRIRKSL